MATSTITHINVGDGQGNYKIIDPDVPSWAKAATKPSYTASEVGALPDSTVIPAAVTSDTVSGWGFTKNSGTLTGVEMNNSNVTVSNGVANLGTVVTDISMNGSAVTVSNGNVNLGNLVSSHATHALTINSATATTASSNTITYVESLTGTETSTSGNLSITPVLKSITVPTLTFDSRPTQNSDNLVKSGDLYTVIVDNEYVTAATMNDLNDRLTAVEAAISSIATSISSLTSSISSLTSMINSMIVTSISSTSDDSHVPSAKCMWDIIGDLETRLNEL